MKYEISMPFNTIGQTEIKPKKIENYHEPVRDDWKLQQNNPNPPTMVLTLTWTRLES